MISLRRPWPPDDSKESSGRIKRTERQSIHADFDLQGEVDISFRKNVDALSWLQRVFGCPGLKRERLRDRKLVA